MGTTYKRGVRPQWVVSAASRNGKNGVDSGHSLRLEHLQVERHHGTEIGPKSLSCAHRVSKHVLHRVIRRTPQARQGDAERLPIGAVDALVAIATLILHGRSIAARWNVRNAVDCSLSAIERQGRHSGH